eukprot:TRINITY_DN14576_c0_g1_i1.p1 TRINITY_DN14576_c0_g1~~TRINITY_DN14576_c0_g1_i1.p1  ORF type:complete len:266 (+),score=33.95 TRINITY_DN14576_c0_g1_i1:198-995(+)
MGKVCYENAIHMCDEGYVAPEKNMSRCVACPQGTTAYKMKKCVPTKLYGVDDCTAQRNCTSCLGSENSDCVWCPVDSKCYEPGSIISNPCERWENMRNKEYCAEKCFCSPPRGVSPINCSWYNQGNIINPPVDPSLWQGADFLPLSYRTAAGCACSGNYDNPLWLSAPASCVRTVLLEFHKGIKDSLKVAIRAATLSWNPLDKYSYVDFVYEMHTKAYSKCCCPGSVAPLVTWYGVFFGGALLPCEGELSILESILDFGRCGCGW